MSEPTQKIIVFLDNIGRTILGEEQSSSADAVVVKNPVILNVQAAEGGRMSVQLFPIFFREFLGDKADSVTFTFNNSSITKTDISALDFRLVGQYNQLFNPNNVFVPAGEQAAQEQKANPAVINLFDE
jgi:hypothetical protein